MNTNNRLVRVAVPAPLRKYFDYKVPATMPVPEPGCRVRVPFGRAHHIAVVTDCIASSAVAAGKLREITAVLDATPILPDDVLQLLNWVADYYLAPPGEVVEAALPAMLRQHRPATARLPRYWQLTGQGRAIDVTTLVRAPMQQCLLVRLQQGTCSQEELIQQGSSARSALKRLQELGWIAPAEREPEQSVPVKGPQLTAEQQAASKAILQSENEYRCFALHGVTGSGKTEVYLDVIARQLQQDRQVLVLVPEIGLTPQLTARFRQRLGNDRVVSLHSGLNDTERLNAWLAAQQGKAAVVIGTRSAVFTPMPRLGLIVVDEEHDPSFKQQEGVRYHARDVAIMRAYRRQLPVVLGSATPSLETMHKSETGSYVRLTLSARAGSSDMPVVNTIDMRNTSVPDGLSPQLVQALQRNLEAEGQSIIYLNRRGYAPVYMCYQCGWIAQCNRCEAKLVYHHRQARLRCHHCGHEAAVPEQCPACRHTELHPLGEGTEKLEAILSQRLPAARIARLDRDSTSRRGELEATLQKMASGQIDILVGTQMLTKGHDFPNVTLVGVVNADQGLYSVDYRGSEQLMQQVMQVAGRAGRREQPGNVLIQTWHPEHAVFHFLKQHDYSGFAREELGQRQHSRFPPYEHLALMRAEAVQLDDVMQFLNAVFRQTGEVRGVTVYKPMPAPMMRRAGRYRGQLLFQSVERSALHGLLQSVVPAAESLPEVRKVRWSLDVDPVDLY